MKSIGADVAFNYKEENTLEILKREGGVDMCASSCSLNPLVLTLRYSYWDNVGGETLDAALDAAKVNGRFIVRVFLP